MYVKFMACPAFMLIMALADPAFAKPLTWPGGWQTMAEVSGDSYTLLNTYTLTPRIGFGLHNEYDRDKDYQMHSLHMTNLLWRGNYPDAQANLYLQSGLGYALADGRSHDSLAAYSGLLADWENRRLYIEYSNRAVHAGTVDKKFAQSGRIGIAPYIAESGALHTWLILQADHRPGMEDSFTLTPLVRLFKNTTMVEAGMRDDGQILFHLMKAF